MDQRWPDPAFERFTTMKSSRLSDYFAPEMAEEAIGATGDRVAPVQTVPAVISDDIGSEASKSSPPTVTERRPSFKRMNSSGSLRELLPPHERRLSAPPVLASSTAAAALATSAGTKEASKMRTLWGGHSANASSSNDQDGLRSEAVPAAGAPVASAAGADAAGAQTMAQPSPPTAATATVCTTPQSTLDDTLKSVVKAQADILAALREQRDAAVAAEEKTQRHIEALTTRLSSVEKDMRSRSA